MASLLENDETSAPFRIDRYLEETESEFEVFYENILKSLYRDRKYRFDKIFQSLVTMRRHKIQDAEIHWNVFAYSIIHSIMVYDRFLDMMKDNPSILERIISMKCLRLCILGGGPSFEVVAICKALCRILAQFSPGKRPPLEVCVTVIDNCADWENEAKYIVSSLHNELCAGNYVEVNFSFIEANLVDNFSLEVVEACKKAHFVTMVKFITEVRETHIKRELFGLINKIWESMSNKSCLFYLDNSGGGLFKKIAGIIDKFPDMSRIYGPSLHNCHKLSIDTIEKFPAGVKGVFKTLKCFGQTTVSSAAWLKTPTLKLDLLSRDDVYKPASVLKDLERHKCKEKHQKVKIKKVMQSKKHR